MSSSSITFRVNSQQMEVIDSYRKFQGKTVSELAREALLEKIEEALDYEMGLRAWEEHLQDPSDVMSHEQLSKELGFV